MFTIIKIKFVGGNNKISQPGHRLYAPDNCIQKIFKDNTFF